MAQRQSLTLHMDKKRTAHEPYCVTAGDRNLALPRWPSPHLCCRSTCDSNQHPGLRAPGCRPRFGSVAPPGWTRPRWAVQVAQVGTLVHPGPAHPHPQAHSQSQVPQATGRSWQSGPQLRAGSQRWPPHGLQSPQVLEPSQRAGSVHHSGRTSGARALVGRWALAPRPAAPAVPVGQ